MKYFNDVYEYLREFKNAKKTYIGIPNRSEYLQMKTTKQRFDISLEKRKKELEEEILEEYDYLIRQKFLMEAELNKWNKETWKNRAKKAATVGGLIWTATKKR